MTLSPSPGSSQRVTGLKCMAKVSVPSGAAMTAAGAGSNTRARSIGSRRRTRRRIEKVDMANLITRFCATMHRTLSLGGDSCHSTRKRAR